MAFDQVSSPVRTSSAMTSPVGGLANVGFATLSSAVGCEQPDTRANNKLITPANVNRLVLGGLGRGSLDRHTETGAQSSTEPRETVLKLGAKNVMNSRMSFPKDRVPQNRGFRSVPRNRYDAPMGAGLMWRAGEHELDCSARTLVMGVLNVTPDSFSDGGRFFDPEAAVAGGIEMAADGADIIDVGGESTRPGAQAVEVEEEIRRVVPVLKRLSAEVDLPLSIDTRKSEVAAAGLDAGASILNDVSAGSDPRMFDLARDSSAGLVLMHMRGDPDTMQQLTDYDDVVADVKGSLRERMEEALARGVSRETICLDPGLGFAKTTPQSLLLMRRIGDFRDLGRPLLVGPSRKSFVGDATGTEMGDRMEGTAAAVAWMAGRGAHIVRVHDVRSMVRVVRMIDAIAGAEDAK